MDKMRPALSRTKRDPRAARVIAARVIAASILCGVAVLTLAACERAVTGAETTRVTRPIASLDLGKVSLGKTTPDDVKKLFGAPDDSLEDGALVYRRTMLRGGDESRHEEQETTTFRFTAGVLSKICRARS